MIRLAHFSDIHLSAPRLGWTLRDLCNKRMAAWINYRLLGRRRRFRHADEVAVVLVDDLARRRPDRVLFSGDATALGFEAEIARAAEMLCVANGRLPPGLAVPGNHDYCTNAAANSGNFERYFAPWLAGRRLDAETYPFAQRVGNVHLVAVNSCTGNWLPWDAGGTVGAGQRERLRRLLNSLEPGPRILVTHYPVCLASGQPERHVHGLRDLAQTVQVASEGGVGLWLHGHRHHHYHVQTPPTSPFPVICAGSATQTGRWCYGEYTIDGATCRGVARIFNPDSRRFEDGPAFELQIRNSSGSVAV
jgi:3',5'-cyclic AMP phosphodiesterase CpdA